MNNLEGATLQDAYLLKVKEAKNARAVVKVDFATYASAIPNEIRIFAYEGVADKTTYYHWIKRVRPDLKYEPYVCRNKAKVLQLFDLLCKDLTGLGDRVYYFVDRDFDELQGRYPSPKLFVTDRYSIENYIVCSSLLDDLLTIDFHCDGHPAVRKNVQEVFEQVYDQFLSVTALINFRIFAARKLSIKQLEDTPQKINLLACVRLKEVSAGEKLADDLIRLEREPDELEIEGLEKEFRSICPKDGYRGKFALQFFIKWLGLLRDDRNSLSPVLFSPVPQPEFSVRGDFSLETLAPKAPAPNGLAAFLEAT